MTDFKLESVLAQAVAGKLTDDAQLAPNETPGPRAWGSHHIVIKDVCPFVVQ